MKYVKQCLIILTISLIGEFFNFIFPFPIPGNIYGMVLMFLLLLSGRIKIHHVKETSNFLLEIMPILFIPSAVGIITKMKELQNIWWQIIIITIITTVIVIATSGLITQIMIRKDKKKKDYILHKELKD